MSLKKVKAKEWSKLLESQENICSICGGKRITIVKFLDRNGVMDLKHLVCMDCLNVVTIGGD